MSPTATPIRFEPVAPGAPAATTFDCPLCGCRFSHGEQLCSACPLSGGCDIVRCPHCGYAFPRSSRLLNWLQQVAQSLLRRMP